MKIGMLFPGYGNQFVGMGKDLYDHNRIIQEYFEQASHCLDSNFVKLCFASSDAELSKIVNAYPALFLITASIAAAIKDAGVKIDIVAGHGVGEYGALYAAGGISLPDGLYLLNKLANFYAEVRQELDVKAVVVDGLSARKLEKICKDNSSGDSEVQIAVYENKTEHIVVGHPEAVDAVAETASDAGAEKIKKSKLEEGFHTPLLNDLFEQLKIYLTKIDFKDLEIPLINNVDAKAVLKAEQVKNSVMRQIVEPVYWHDVLKQFVSVDLIIIPAPAKLLLAEIQVVFPDKKILVVQQPHDLDNLKEYIASQEAPVVEAVESDNQQ